MFTVTPIPAFQDNYIWMLTADGHQGAIVIDPGDADPVLAELQRQQRDLTGILITHHHPDHTGGVEKLSQHYSTPVYGPLDSPFQNISNPIRDGDELQLLGQSLKVRAVPGHTLDHISYFHDDAEMPQLFCGDTLFLAGCGRLFEGSAAQMLNAMHYFKSLPSNTEIYCTHEYSLANLAFAQAVEPDNREIDRVKKRCQELRDDNKPTLPSSIDQECRINPFLRTQHDSVKRAAARYANTPISDELSVFTAIRDWKNHF